MIIRAERAEDERELAALIDAAFGDTKTSVFTAEIRASPGYVPELTFVADDDGELVGFTMLSYVTAGELNVLILTPMAVRPDRQRAGVGKQVVRAAIAGADRRGEPVVLVEGVPSYYPQFGFRSASELGFERPDPRIPEPAWMALPLDAYDPAVAARVVYPDFFPLRPVPELPEVESVRRAIAPALEGRRLEHVEIDDIRLTRPEDPLEIAAELTGERVEQVDRRGKYLIVRFASGRALLIHLRMTGSLVREPGETSHVRAVLRLDDGSTVGYRDVRRFGTWLLLEPGELEPYLGARLGEEPLVAAFTAKGLGERLEGRRAPLKAALLDQRTLAGLGNIYVDEALWYAKLHPLRPAGSLDGADLRRLHRAIRKALELGIARQGSTLSDYRLPDGTAGTMQKEFRAYGRTGEPCDRCGTPLAKTRVAGRGTWYCPSCQKL